MTEFERFTFYAACQKIYSEESLSFAAIAERTGQTEHQVEKAFKVSTWEKKKGRQPRLPDHNGHLLCASCDTRFPLSGFYSNSSTRWGVSSKCKRCTYPQGADNTPRSADVDRYLERISDVGLEEAQQQIERATKLLRAYSKAYSIAYETFLANPLTLDCEE